METVPQFDLPQPPRRRWLWLAGIVATFVLVAILTILKWHPAVVLESDRQVPQVEQQTNTQIPMLRSNTDLLASTSELPKLLSSSDQEMVRFAAHKKLLSLQSNILQITQLSDANVPVPMETSQQILTTYDDLVTRLDHDNGLSEDAESTAKQLLQSRNTSLSIQRIREGTASASIHAATAGTLLRVITAFKAPTTNYYTSYLVEEFRDQSASLTEKVALAKAFAQIGDPELDETILSLLADVPRWPDATEETISSAQSLMAQISSQ
ncbi:MAG: hypothetical protein IPK32_09775 [Verrucomicrobiaceae bacterium]|nr:hypothetical protein [Verrucomicrobiaceae bacterium]